MAMLEPNERVTLKQFLVEHFNLSELQDLVFNMGIGSDKLPATTTPEMARALIEYCEHRDKVSCLLIEVQKARPAAEFGHVLGRLASCAPHKKLEIVVHGANMANLQEVLAEFAKKLGLSPEDISLHAAAPGSLQLLVSLPLNATDRLVASEITTLADGKYQVASIREFSALDPVRQARWRHASRLAAGAPAPIPMAAPVGASTYIPIAASAPAAASTGLGLGKLLLILLVVVVAAGGAGVLLAPTLTIRNESGSPIILPSEAPIIGRELPVGSSQFKILPGDYRVTRTSPGGVTGGDSIRITGPFGLDTGTFTTDLSFTVLKDGTEVNLDDSIQVTARTNIEIIFTATDPVTLTGCLHSGAR